MFMQAPAPIVILDGPELVFQLVNPAYQRIFPGRELLNKPLLEALPELADTPIPGFFRRVYETGEPVVMQEMTLMMARHEGQPLEEIYWTFTYQARRDAHGVIDGVRVFAHDITEQVRTREAVAASARQAQALAEQLSATNQQLTRVNVDLDTFIYTASHDLKAPITNIEGLVQTLLTELPILDPASEVPFILSLMQDSVERFARTIEHLTDVSKLHKAFDEPSYPVPLAAVVEDVRLDLAPLLRDTGGRLLVDVQAVPTVTFSEKNLRSVVFNLLSNALKYRHPDRSPVVQLRALPEGAYVVLEVQDNGLGLDLSRENQLFAMFQRLHSHVPGSGVGLYMVKRLVENAGGRITVRSTVGEGSTFAVYLPG
ncbi:PAS domain-containing sensor histidine kinase [Hymenobacter sp. ASUV-10]|uniref:histidine kinase n=1 Tax=Hymenobacter aranciens TaxID=3063996 RepID=A0ABT9B835_9BACT|nr:PAS domain-containing sensor histidine kinase [Hymenobacter sp. ASUV-10]MDO7873955.1 PAS domain-containing sensor histidine kinase [Hymenobacter sp. ASUV-10]